MTALYTKYRPQDFDEVVGQEAVVRTLRNAIEADKVRQAYLFAGPRGTGKTSLARILAKALNCAQGPTPKPDGTCHACTAISNGTSMDVIEMDAASQRGIDDVRLIRDNAVLQPVEGRYKVYILDEAHQLTDAAWNALLKIVEEPPPHLVFVFCTTSLDKVLATVRSRCQTFLFARPRLPELVALLRRVADGEGFDVPDAALALVARAAKGSFRDAVSTLDQLAAATGGEISVQSVLQLLGAVDEEALFRLCDLVIDRDPAGALTHVEELSEQGQDIGRLVVELLEHLRHLLLVQHLGEVPDNVPVTDESRERLRAQANQIGEATVLRLCDLLGRGGRGHAAGRRPSPAARARTRKGDPPRRRSLAGVARLPTRAPGAPCRACRTCPPVRATDPGTVTESVPEPEADTADEDDPAPPPLELQQLQESWSRAVLDAVEQRSIPVASMLREAHPVALDDDRLTVEFAGEAEFHRKLAEEPKNSAIIRDALYDVTGRKLTFEFTLGERSGADDAPEEEHSEEKLVALFKETFDAKEVDE